MHTAQSSTSITSTYIRCMMEFLLSIFIFCLIGLQHYQLIRSSLVLSMSELALTRGLSLSFYAAFVSILVVSLAFGVIYYRRIIILSRHHQLDFNISTRTWLKSGFFIFLLTERISWDVSDWCESSCDSVGFFPCSTCFCALPLFSSSLPLTRWWHRISNL